MLGRASAVSRVIAASIIAAFAALVLAVLVPMLGAHLPSIRPMMGDGVEAAAQNIITIDQPLQLSAMPAISLTKGALLAGPRVGAGPRSLILDRAVFEVDLATKVLDDSEHVEAAMNTLALPLYQQLSSLGFESVDVRHGTAKIRWSGGEEETISDIATKLTPRKNGLLSWEGSLVLRGKLLKVEATIGPPARTAAARTGARALPGDTTSRSWPLRATLRGEELFARIEGAASNANGVEFEGIADINVPRVANFLRWHGIGWSPATGIVAAILHGPVSWRGGALSFQSAKFAVDGQEGTGALTFRYRSGRPLIEGTIAVDNFNVSALLQPAISDTASQPQKLRHWTELETAMPSIVSVDADLRVSVKRLLFDATPVGSAVAAFTVRDGTMHADIADIDVGVARGSVQLTADMTKASPVYAVRSRFETPDTGWLSEPFLSWPSVRSRSIGTVELASSGATFGDMMRTARGKMHLTFPEGAKLPIDLRALRTHTQAARTNDVEGWGTSVVETFVDEIEIKTLIEPTRIIIDRADLKTKPSRPPHRA